jgi:hypothetical protein
VLFAFDHYGKETLQAYITDAAGDTTANEHTKHQLKDMKKSAE